MRNVPLYPHWPSNYFNKNNLDERSIEEKQAEEARHKKKVTDKIIVCLTLTFLSCIIFTVYLVTFWSWEIGLGITVGVS